MRLCDFLRHLNGSLTIRLFEEKNNKNELLMEESLNSLNDKCDKSFNIFDGFNNTLWEMQVHKWSIYDNVVNILIRSK